MPMESNCRIINEGLTEKEKPNGHAEHAVAVNELASKCAVRLLDVRRGHKHIYRPTDMPYRKLVCP